MHYSCLWPHEKNRTSLVYNPVSLKHLQCEFKVILATPLSMYFSLREVHQTAFVQTEVSFRQIIGIFETNYRTMTHARSFDVY